MRSAMCDHVWHRDRTPAEQRAFRLRAAVVTRRFVDVAAMIAIAIMLVSWPIDYLAFRGRGSPALLWHITEWRLIVAGWIVGVVLGCRAFPRRTFPTMVVVSVPALVLLGMSVGRIGGLGTNFFYTFYLQPFTTILIFVPIVPRVAVTLTFAASCVVGYLITDPAFLSYAYSPTAIAVLAVGSGLSILIGHLFYDLVRVSHFRGRDLENEQVRSERLFQRLVDRTTRELQRQVSERSRELGSALAKLVNQPRQPMGTGRVVDGRYRVVRRLGAGGMGTVHEVERLADGRRLALKTLRGRVDTDAMARFAREAEIASGLDHPNLVAVIDLGVTDGELFLVMEMIDGGSLESERVRFGDRTWAMPILVQVARGLAAIHDRGIVHRDLKPANILVANGVARIADFGLASLGASADADTATSNAGLVGRTAPRLTRPGDIFGTTDYMAPELAGGTSHVAPSGDIFAFGVLAFEMLVGRAPFSEAPVLARMNGTEIARPGTDVRCGAVVERCLDLDPARRPTAVELVGALAEATRVHGPMPASPGRWVRDASLAGSLGSGPTLRPA